MAFREVLLVSEDLNIPANEAVSNTSSTVDFSTLHYYAVFHLGVGDSGVVSDAGVWADVGIGAYITVVADDDWPPYRCTAVDDCALAYTNGVGHRGAVLDGSVVVGFQLVEDELVGL